MAKFCFFDQFPFWAKFSFFGKIFYLRPNFLPDIQKHNFANQILLQIRRKRHLKNNQASERNREKAENVPNRDDDQRAVVDLNVLVHDVPTRVQRNLVQILDVEVEIEKQRQNWSVLNIFLDKNLLSAFNP